MSRSARGVPAKPERGNSRSVAAQATAHRVRAMLDDVLCEIEAERVRGGRDWRKKLVDDFHESKAPLSWLQAFREAAGVKDIEPVATATLGMAGMAGASLAGVFASVMAAQAQEQAAAAVESSSHPIIDVTATHETRPADDEPVDW